MTKVTIPLNVAGVSRTCHVVIGAGILGHAVREAGANFLAADEHVLGLHQGVLAMDASTPSHQLPRGEAMKCFAELESLLVALAGAGLDRGATLLAFGGGALCDLSGLASSLYMRGIDWVAVPTTLLAQVDASVGGKTAINLGPGKNLVGTFHQPKLVIADTSLLATLDDNELRSGLGEVLKTAVLGATVAKPDSLGNSDQREPAGNSDDQSLFTFLEGADPAAIEARDPALFATIVESCVRFKARTVEADEREAGQRKQLNLGHTFAHAVEHVAGYGTIPHGIAVAAGIGDALAMSRDLGLLEDEHLPTRCADLATRLGLPKDTAHLRQQTGLALEPDDLLQAMALDKKSTGGEARFVLPKAIGDIAIDIACPTPKLG